MKRWHKMIRHHTRFSVVSLLLALAPAGMAQFEGWPRSGVIHVLTTPEGANLPESAEVKDFPVLVRLDRDWFDFGTARPDGRDVRFADGGVALAHEIERWDAAAGVAELWVRVPVIRGNAVRELRMYWGKEDAESAADGRAVFNESNGYASVLHLADPGADAAGGTMPKDEGTTAVAGVVGKARHFAERKGIFGGEGITGFPSGTGPMTTEAWFRAERTNGTVLAWGEEKRPCKVMFNFLSPPRMAIQCYFADVEAKSPLATGQWYHVVHTYSEKDSRVYINGVLDGVSDPMLDLPKASKFWLGGWYGNYGYEGDVDEVRISRVARSPEWIRLQHENQKPLQTLVGPLVSQGKGMGLVPEVTTVAEGGAAEFRVEAGGARKIYWSVERGGEEKRVAVDRFRCRFEAGRVTGDETATVVCRVVTAEGLKVLKAAVTVRESVPDPVLAPQGLPLPQAWDGRRELVIEPMIANREAMAQAGAAEVAVQWEVTPLAVIKEERDGKLVLKRAQNSGDLTVKATVNNGGNRVTASGTIAVREPESDPWVERVPEADEKPRKGQFYAREGSGEGTLHYRGVLEGAADAVFLRVTVDGKPYRSETAKPDGAGRYAFAVKLKPGLVRYAVAFGRVHGGSETVLDEVGDLVCGDAFIIDGQSNALATDTGEKSPPETSPWIRSYGRPNGNAEHDSSNLWCLPVWKAEKGEEAELGWWGMELAKQLVASQQVPVCIINAAVGGTRIDQHQRLKDDPTNRESIYGRMLWRVREAKLTHGIRAILWHQGESDQGSDGPTGGYGWETYQELFMEMSAGWKTDFPNVAYYYTFQIWPDSCSMGGRMGSGDRLRERQRTMVQRFSRLRVMSTLGIVPPGPCHFPLIGWAEIANLVLPLMEADLYGKKPERSVTAPDLVSARIDGKPKREIVLEFNQPVEWRNELAGQFYLDGEKDLVTGGSGEGNVVRLQLKDETAAKSITYLKEASWDQMKLLRGKNGIAALTFCEVPLQPAAE